VLLVVFGNRAVEDLPGTRSDRQTGTGAVGWRGWRVRTMTLENKHV
jgi:hypothetical protein